MLSLQQRTLNVLLNQTAGKIFPVVVFSHFVIFLIGFSPFLSFLLTIFHYGESNKRNQKKAHNSKTMNRFDKNLFKQAIFILYNYYQAEREQIIYIQEISFLSFPNVNLDFPRTPHFPKLKKVGIE